MVILIFCHPLNELENILFETVPLMLHLKVTGIPVGLDPVPLFANLFLVHYESQLIGKMKNVYRD